MAMVRKNNRMYIHYLLNPSQFSVSLETSPSLSWSLDVEELFARPDERFPRGCVGLLCPAIVRLVKRVPFVSYVPDGDISGGTDGGGSSSIFVIVYTLIFPSEPIVVKHVA